MENSHRAKNEEIKETILLLSNLRGLNIEFSRGVLSIIQLIDQKKLSITENEISEIIKRTHEKNPEFYQLNYHDGRKILLTEKLIGFKPISLSKSQIHNLPKVVTTPDLRSVIGAIEDEIDLVGMHSKKAVELEKVFEAIENGAQNIGIDTTFERIMLSKTKINTIKGNA